MPHRAGSTWKQLLLGCAFIVRIGPNLPGALLPLPPVAVVALTVVVGVVGCSSDKAVEQDAEDDLDTIQDDVEQALADDKSDSPNRPAILGDIFPNTPAMGQFRPERRYIGWTFNAEERPIIRVATTVPRGPRSSMVALLLWRPDCNSPWRTVSRSTGEIRQELPTDGSYLIVVGPRSARAAGTVETLLTLAEEVFSAVGPSFCPPGPRSRPPVPDPLPPVSTSGVGTIPGAFQVTDRGSASYTIPLELPPGRAGMQPQLAISYDSSAGNGLLGMGFQLQGLSTISRCPQDPAHDGARVGIQFVNTDNFCLDGARLIQVPGRQTEYRTERETFTRVRAFGEGAGGPDYFRAWTKDGRVLDFGWDPNDAALDSRVRSKQMRSGGNYTIAWPLRRVEDRSGNFYTISYEKLPGPSGETVEHRPLTIAYTGWTDSPPGGKPVVAPTKFVTFSYVCDGLSAEDNCKVGEVDRPDPFRGFAHGVEVARTALLRRIDISGPLPTPSGAPGATALARQYRLSYRNDPATSPSQLASITECAAAGSSFVCKPPTRFRWASIKRGFGAPVASPASAPDNVGFPPLPGTPPLPDPIYSPLFVMQPSLLHRTIDMDGDGRNDLLFPQGGTWKVLRGGDQGRFDPDPLPTGIVTGDGRQPPWVVTPMDYDGDGRTDLLVGGFERDRWMIHVALSRGTYFAPAGEWFSPWRGGESSSQPHDRAPIPAPAALLPIVADFDGDGRQDALVCDPYSGVWSEFSAPANGSFNRDVDSARPSSRVRWVESPSAPTAAAHCLEESILPIDLDGDGTIEVLASSVSADSVVRYATPSVITNLAPNDLQGPPGARHNAWVRTLDANGDGLLDIVTLRPGITPTNGELRLLVNRGDGQFSGVLSDGDSGVVDRDFGLRPETLKAAVVVDYDHDGRSDLIFAGTVAGRPLGVALRSDGATLVSAPWQAPWDVTVEQLVRYPTLLDVDGDGVLDLATFRRRTSSASDGNWDLRPAAAPLEMPGVLREIREGLNAQLGSASYQPTIRIAYSSLGDRNVHRPTASGTCKYPTRCLQGGGVVVASVETDNGNVGDAPFTERRYDYADARMDMRGRGFLGFSTLHMSESSTGADHYREYFQGNDGAGPGDPFQPDSEVDYRIAGLLRSERTETPLPDGTRHVSSVVNTPSVRTFQYGAAPAALPSLQLRPYTYLPYIQQSVATSTQDGLIYRSLITTTELDTSAFACIRSVTRDFGDGTTDKVEVTEFQNSADEWLLCLPRARTHTSTTPEEERARKTALTYVAQTRLLHTVTRAPDDAAAYQLATYFHDRYGNTVQVDRHANVPGCIDGTITPCTRVSTATYDDDGTFPITETNPVGHRIDLRFHPTFGELLVYQDENGLATRWALDGFARVGRELAPDNTETTTRLSPIFNPARPGFEVRVAVTGGGDVVRRYDSLGREVWASHAILKGRSYFETRYNDRGWVDRTSRPTLEGSAPEHFTIYDYDNVGRMSSVQYPDGTSATAKYSVDRIDDGAPLGLVVDATDQSRRITRTYHGRRGETIATVMGADTPRAASTRYVYGAFGHLRRTVAPGESGSEVTTTITTDAYGRKLRHDDPDLGRLDYVWTGFDELDHELNPALEQTSYVRDAIGRVIRRIDPDPDERASDRTSDLRVETAWTWDTAPFGVGRIAETRSAPHQDSRAVHRQVFRYDGFSRPAQVTTSLGANAGIFVARTTYDEAGRVDLVSYPSSSGLGPFAIRHKYDATGNLTDIHRWKPEAGGHEAERYWHAEEVDADGQLTIEDFGNDLRTTRVYYPETGRQHTIETGHSKGPLLQSFTYNYFADGSLFSRWDHTTEERFTYDELGRLATSDSSQAPGAGLNMEYDTLGNIRSKSDVGSYVYLAPRPGGGFRAHAVSQAGSASYEYDTATGGITKRVESAAGLNQTIEYTIFGKPSTMGAVGDEPKVSIEYDADGNRITRYSDRDRTIYVGDLYQRDTVAPSIRLPLGQARTTHRYFIRAAGRLVAQVVRRSGPEPSSLVTRPRETEETLYVHDDHLGSSTVISGQGGALVEKRSFDAFGKPRQPNLSDSSSPPRSSVPRGFTGHEDDLFGLVNMKGRIYDPALGRFMQPDPFVGSQDSQGLNRYSYVRNSPLRFKDPSGYFAEGEDERVGHIPPERYQALAERHQALLEHLADSDVGAREVKDGVDSVGERAQVVDHERPGSRQLSDSQLNRAGQGALSGGPFGNPGAMMLTPTGRLAGAVRTWEDPSTKRYVPTDYGLAGWVPIVGAYLGLADALRQGALVPAAVNLGFLVVDIVTLSPTGFIRNAAIKAVTAEASGGVRQTMVGAAAVERANQAQAAGRTSGAAAELVVGERVFTDVSLQEGTRVLHEEVQKALSLVPESVQRSVPFHGYCAEPGCISQALNAGVDPRGGQSAAVRIRAIGHPKHGSIMEACPSCQAVLEFFGINH